MSPGPPNSGEALPPLKRQGDRPGPRLSLFDPIHAPLIVSWVRSERELTWLAPGTAPPLTLEKVTAWGSTSDRRFLFWRGELVQPVAYAELNNMPERSNQMWIGHFLVDPVHRGRRVGTRFAQALLGYAFQRFGAQEVLLVVFPGNVGAIRCYQHAGMNPLGYERKHFVATDREHVFLRMGINAATYQDLLSAGRMPAGLLPLTGAGLAVSPADVRLARA